MSHWSGLDLHVRQPVCEGRGVMMGDYLARIRRDGSAGQTVPKHLRNVAELMAGFAEGSGLSATARLIGILHDLGKCTAEFSAYLEWCVASIRATSADGARSTMRRQAVSCCTGGMGGIRKMGSWRRI